MDSKILKLAFDKYRIIFTEGSACECMEWLLKKQSNVTLTDLLEVKFFLRVIFLDSGNDILVV